MKPIFCIYHADCLDGFTAAWAVYKARPDTIFHPGVHGSPPPDCTGKDVVLVDFCYKAPDLQALVNQANSVVVLDHHKTAIPEIEKVAGLSDKVIDMDRSGAMIAWEYFHPGKRPPVLVQHVQDRDLWRFSMNYTKEICAVLFALPQEFEAWDAINHDLTKTYNYVVDKGELLLVKHQADVRNLIKFGSHRITIGNHYVPAVNCAPIHASDVGSILAKGAQFSATYHVVGDQINFSLRSTPEGLDVSVIAAQFGGGGHRNAAGFKIKLPFTALVANVTSELP